MNKTIKIIDLLNKIANGEEVPKTIKYEDQLWKYNPCNDFEGLSYGGCLLNYVCLKELNNTVEIIEDNDKLEKIKWNEKESRADILRTDEEIEVLAKRTETLKKKIAELVDHVNKIEEKLEEDK